MGQYFLQDFLGVTLLRFAATITALIFVAVGTLVGQSVTVQVETKEVGNGESSYLRVLCTSDISLSGVSIPLKIGTSNFLVVDSVSFVYTIAAKGFRLLSQITNDNRTGFVNVFPKIQTPLPFFPAPGGEICRIHFHTSAASPSGFVPVDTFYLKHTEGHQVYYDEINATDRYGTTLLPDFIAGGITIERATTAAEEETAIPGLFALEQNYPNPFNPSTQIAFSLDRPEHVSIDIFNAVGNRVATLAQGRYSAGRHLISWDADRFPSGVYFTRLSSGSHTITRKMLLVK